MMKRSFEAFVGVTAVGLVLTVLGGVASATPGLPPTPEIDGGSLASAIALLGFGSMALKNCFRHK
jgi:hypothetical protein